MLPEIKILDFGLARITDADVAVTTIVTEVGRIQGTLTYMSPEQARGNPDETSIFEATCTHWEWWCMNS